MAPQYPFTRKTPSALASSSTTNNLQNGNENGNGRPIVVSASGVAPNSPAAGLSANSPSTLRARIPSPRTSTGIASTFQNDTSSYPSPPTLLSKVKSKRKKNKSEGGKQGWLKVEDDSPSRGREIPRYDARGYPTRDRPPDPGLKQESAKSVSFSKGHRPSKSRDSFVSDVSSTGAGIDGDPGRFLSPERPSSYYAPIDGASPSALYPPTISYALSAPSYSPYEINPARMVNPQPVPSLYRDSMISLHSNKSEDSMTHFRKYDSLRDMYPAFSISSKGGKRHLGDMFSLPADPTTWSYLGPEADDDFHDPDFKPSRKSRLLSAAFTSRGAANLGCLISLFIILVILFAGYPVLYAYLSKPFSTLGGYNLGGINSTGQIPNIGPFQLIDRDTPSSAFTVNSLETGDSWELIFSDEFNNDGRTFYDGDDPYWQAEDLHYWQTNNLEWYDPRALTTKGGKLVITLDKMHTHGLNYQGGMMTTWNRFCFTGGYVEASVSLPGTSNVYGLWPAVWAMGNLGRAGYGGTLDGMWPYSYDSCDVGTMPNQTLNGLPEITTTEGDPMYDNNLSYLPGQRLSRCTCTNDETHPGPTLSNGSFVGRGAPEIDMFEATVDSNSLIGGVSQSGQWAPFNPWYSFINTSSSDFAIYDDTITVLNPYQGGVYQQATSAISKTDQNCYTGDTGCFSTYGFEYSPGPTGYITWLNDNKKAWTIRGTAMAANADTEVGQRIVSQEPMYLIVNLGLSENFGAIDYDGLASLWPVTMEVDYIRVYQDPNNRQIGCNPSAMPTSEYISLYPDAYSNPNITVFSQIPGAVKPKNILVDTC